MQRTDVQSPHRPTGMPQRHVVALSPVMRTAYYWQQFCNENARIHINSDAWILRHLEVMAVAKNSRWLLLTQDTEFLGNLAYLSIHGPKKFRGPLHDIFKCALDAVFGPQKEEPRAQTSAEVAKETAKRCLLLEAAEDDGENDKEGDADVHGRVED